MADQRETSIDHIAGESTATLFTSEQKWITKIAKLKERCPDDVEIISVNSDGSLLVHIPSNWLKIAPPKKMSDEQKQAASDRFKQMWASGDMNKE